MNGTVDAESGGRPKRDGAAAPPAEHPADGPDSGKINLYRLIPKLTEAFVPMDICDVNDHVVRLETIAGEGEPESRTTDSFLLVLDGECTLTVNGSTVRLLEGHAFRLARGATYRFKSIRTCLVLRLQHRDGKAT